MADHIVTPAEGWAGIAAALERARPGDIVRIAAGQYRGDATLCVPSGVSLIGDAGNELIFGGAEVAILVERAKDVSIEGLTLRGYEGMADVGEEGETADKITNGLIRIVASETICVSGNRITAGAKRRNGISVVGSHAVAVTHNRVSGAGRGIYFWSSVGEIVGNDCWGTLNGIVTYLSYNSPSNPSRTIIRDNFCHDNQNGGIVLVSSKSEAIENNDCSDNGINGISLENDSGIANACSCALIRGNRCYGNGQGGIVLNSSASDVIESNECWSNDSVGIAIIRHPGNPSIGSHAKIGYNHCHDNKQGGIFLASSESEAIAGNDCWANGLHGICLQRHSNSVDAPSKALIRDNHCHVNNGVGIALFSSESEAIVGNDCWGNGKGIALQRGADSLDAPSHALIHDNRLADNGAEAIGFLGSTGRAYGNHFRDNGINGAEFEEDERSLIPTPEEPDFEDNEVDPKLDLAGPYLAALRVPLEQAVPTGQKRHPPSATGLAEFLTSGCHGCFRTFWIGHRNADDGRKPDKTVETDPRHWQVSIAGEPVLTHMPANAQGARAALIAQIEAWRRKNREDAPGAAHWAVLVAPDESDAEAVAAALLATVETRASGDYVAGGRLAPPLTLPRLDGATPLRDRLSAALLARGARRGAQIEALLRLKLLWTGLALPLLAAALIQQMGWQAPLWAWQDRWLGLDPVAEWKLSDWSGFALAAAACLFSFRALLNSQLPTHLRFGAGHPDAPDSWWHRLVNIGLPGLVDKLNPAAIFPQRWRDRWRDKADLGWQCRQLMRGKASVVPLILADITAWHAGDIDWLSRLAAAMPKGKTLVSLLHIDGRLMLRPLIIDPPAAPWRSGFDLFLSDDESRLRLSHAAVPSDTADIAAQLRPLAALNSDDAKELSTALGNDIWSALDLLPSLPLASAPTARAVVQRLRADASLNPDLMERLLPAASEFFGGKVAGSAIDQTTLDKLFAWSKSSRALHVSEVREGSQYFERLTGRVGARRRVGEIMRSLWPDAADWREYVAAALRFGIWLRVTDLTRRLPVMAADPQAILIALRDFEGLHFLGQEYQALRTAGCVVHGDERYDSAWGELRAVVEALPAAPQHDVLFARYLAAEHACHRHAAELAEAQGAAIRHWLADPVRLASGEGAASAGDAFCHASARHIVALQNMEAQSRPPRVARLKELLWRNLPPALIKEIEALALGGRGHYTALSALFGAAASEAEIEALVRFHASTPERTLYALSYAALRSIERRHGRAPQDAEAVAALIPVGRTLIDVRDRLLSRTPESDAAALAEDFARGAAAAVKDGDAAAAFLTRDGAAATLLAWLTPSREEQLTNFEAQLAIDLRGVYEQAAAKPAAEAPAKPPAPIQLRFDASTSAKFSLPGRKSKPS